MARTAAILLFALLAGLSVAHAKVVVQKIDPSSELSDLDTADVDGDATFSPPQLVCNVILLGLLVRWHAEFPVFFNVDPDVTLQKFKKPEKDIIELAPLPEINPVDKVKSLLAPVVSGGPSSPPFLPRPPSLCRYNS